MIIGIRIDDFYLVNRFLMKYGNFSLVEIENMYPYEYEIYMYLVMKEIKEEIEARKQARQG